MITSRIKRVLLRNEFYRDSYRQLMWVSVLSILVNIVLIFAVLIESHDHGRIFYYASTDDGTLMKMQGMAQPLMTDTAVLSWVNRVVPQMYDLNFLNYRQSLDAKQKYFTEYGWTQFLYAFKPTLDQITKGEFVVHAAPSDVPYITRKGIFQGEWMWEVQIPLLVSYQHGSQEDTQNIVWTLLLQRQDNTKSDQLLGISQVVQSEVGSNSNGN
ncbi:MAG: hypothetical protein EBX40_00845 [Gammaproteobacteria bacterium]|nr:hypothetical protein [Gammaproteobacteria bacterium]